MNNHSLQNHPMGSLADQEAHRNEASDSRRLRGRVEVSRPDPWAPTGHEPELSADGQGSPTQTGDGQNHRAIGEPFRAGHVSYVWGRWCW